MFKNARFKIGIGLPSATLNASNVELVTTLLGSAFQATIVWGKKEHLKYLSPALVCCEGRPYAYYICLT